MDISRVTPWFFVNDGDEVCVKIEVMASDGEKEEIVTCVDSYVISIGLEEKTELLS